jgi:geranylgeranyl pyrophosphate synthase
MTFKSHVADVQAHIEAVIDAWLPQDDPHTARLCEAMRYSVLGGGKRLRALLVYTTGEAFGATRALLDAPAAAVEIIHAYSLIHDDLPAMDDDDLRRGRPSCHRAFDEGTAILAGDALQAYAFEVLAVRTAELADAARIQMLVTLAAAIGTHGMAGGQAIDLGAVGRRLSAGELELMHRRKTGALITASVELGAQAAGTLAAAEQDALRRYGDELGLAFQIQDDILDVTGDTTTLGKPQGSDALREKPNYPSILGLDAARALAARHRDAALAAIATLGSRAGLLREMAHFVVDRAH